MFGTILKNLRLEKNITQKDLAKHLGVSDRSVGYYETGQRTPPPDILEKIADYFNVTVDFLLGRTDIRNLNQVESRINRAELTPKEKYPEVQDVEEAMKIILEQPGLMLKGEILSDESKIILANAIQMGLRTAEELEKKKNKGDSHE